MSGENRISQLPDWLSENHDRPIGIQLQNPPNPCGDVSNSEESFMMIGFEQQHEALRAILVHPQILIADVPRMTASIKQACGVIPPGVIDVGIIDNVLGTHFQGHPNPSMVREICKQVPSASVAAMERIRRDHELATILRNIADRGYLIDRAAAVKTINSADRLRLNSPEFITDPTRDTRLNPRSVQQLLERFKKLGAHLTASDGQDTPKLNAATLTALTEDDQPSEVRKLARAVLDFRQQETKALQVRPLLQHASVEDRVHPTIDVVGARTGRMTYREPALQALAKSLRHLLLAEPSNLLVAADLDQIELRIAAGLSEDDRLLAAINSGDFHAQTATSIFGSGAGQRERNIAKMTTYAILYGAGIETIAAATGLTHGGASTIRESFFSTYPKLAAWLKDVQHAGTATTVYGRTIHIRPDLAYKAPNQIIQSTARDLFADMALDAHNNIGLNIWLPLHDELIVQTTRPKADATAEQLQQTMTTEFLGVPITASAKVLGARWGTRP